MFLLVGRLTDVRLPPPGTQSINQLTMGSLKIFGRRWFFIIGSAIGTVGSVICATAHGVGQLIAGETLIGLAAGFQISFFWVVSEIVPMNRRFIAASGIFLWSVPTVRNSPKAEE